VAKSNAGTILLERLKKHKMVAAIKEPKYIEKAMNRRIRNRTYGGVRGRELIAPSYSIYTHLSYLEPVSSAILENGKNNSAIKNNLSCKIMLDVNLL